ncbi:MAG: response regulator [Mediterranea sp.]|jgi:signal transduction histidine kinase/ligand-binding sensor domain-containing protein/DNA-binding NarL/FixJ family response regulator|nr:response regulator [Mediterranea sp.]
MKRHLLIPLLLLLATYPHAQERYADRCDITYITMANGLPHDFVDDLYKDSRSFLWVSTAGGGLARYDGYDFVDYNSNTPHCPLKSNFIRNVCEDAYQRLWVASEGGTDIIDLRTLKPVLPPGEGTTLATLLERPGNRVAADSRGNIWIYCANNLHRVAFDERGDVRSIATMNQVSRDEAGIFLRDVDNDGQVWLAANGEIRKVHADDQGQLQTAPIGTTGISVGMENRIADFVLKEDEVWIGTNHGLFRYHRDRGVSEHYLHQPDNPRSLTQEYITALAITADDQLVIATLRGVNIYHPRTNDFERVTSAAASQAMPARLNSNFANCLLADEGHLWIGTETGGINQVNPKRLVTDNYRHSKENPGSLSENPVNAIYEDTNHNLWVGTVEGGLNRKPPGSDNFAHYTREHDGLSHNTVSAITADPDGQLWVGTWGEGINLLSLKNPDRPLKVLSTRTDPEFPIDFVGSLTYDPINRGMWVGANQGLYFYDLDEKKFYNPFADGNARKIRGSIGSIIDKEGKLWVGCLEGVYIVDLHTRTPQGTFAYRHLVHKLDTPHSRLIEKITCFCETRDGTLWLGSNGYGIYHRTVDARGNERFKAYTTLQGLPNNSIRGLLEDNAGNLWIATNNGLACYHPTTDSFVSYTTQDGLTDLRFYWNASCRSVSGTLYFGSASGLVAIRGTRPAPPVSASDNIRFTRLLIGNEEIRPGDPRLPEDIAVSRELRLHEREKSFSVEFSSLSYVTNEALAYSYRLRGFEDTWTQAHAGRRFASYTNLPPGKYTLQVRYAPAGKEEGGDEASIDIVISPYFYKSGWFVLLVIIVGAVAVWQLYQWRIRTLKRQKEYLHRTVEQRTQELERQKEQLIQMSRKVQELTLDKIAFFTNITHEFRTPITLIIGPIERALKLSHNPQVIEQLNFVARNSKYLLSLVNQLMDFRKVESGNLEIVRTEGNFRQFVDALLAPFEVFAAERDIVLRRYYRMDRPEILFDEEAMRKIFTNLLSNALKFTPNGGRVEVYIALIASTADDSDAKKDTLYICIRDTGTGIPEADINRIFNRFYQSQNQTKHPVYGQAGTGIGLYLCKRIVKVLGGEINARNNPRKGSSFRILLPLERGAGATATDIVDIARPATDTQPNVAAEQPIEKEVLTMLVVEDNADMRAYIRSILRDEYNVVEAGDGAEALQVLNSSSVDFIISDLMMPVMNGIELSRRVKENFAISHIPFLMLTAKTSPEARLESYRTGVDEYLLKPFDETLLLTRIHNILESRRRYQRRFSLDMNVDTLCIEDDSRDKKFMAQLMEVVKEHYKNPYFEVGDFCEALGVSKSLLGKKLQSLLGQSAAQFVRNYRLKMAHELMARNRGTKNFNVSEIAYEVGFNDPKYFTRCYTKTYGTSPRMAMHTEAG